MKAKGVKRTEILLFKLIHVSEYSLHPLLHISHPHFNG
jgi:hypothetical protein